MTATTVTTKNEMERRCLVDREVRPREALIRFALGPDAQVLPDLGERLGGRGAWVSATAEAVSTAAQKGHFARTFKQKVQVPEALEVICRDGLRQRALQLVGLARKAGELVAGFDQVRALVRERQPAYMIEASDSAEDGRRKVLALALKCWGASLKTVGCFTSVELGDALGREPVMHVVWLPGGLATRFGVELTRLSGFVPLLPEGWDRTDA
jgi:uncharacterized protein